jgi:predicted GNAT superfamily acetyltransferase
MKTSRKNSGVEIRKCLTLADFEGAVHVQRRVWGGDQVAPVPLFVVAAHSGGQVLGAFEEGRMIGFTLAFAGVRDGYYLHSHMAAVLPELRDRGIGRRLKLAQREDALARGIQLIEWTFDPLESKNAYFNLNKLGAIARRLIPNCYGITQSALHHGLPTDRLVAEWWLASERVRGAVSGSGESSFASKRTGTERVALPEGWERLRVKDRGSAAKAQSKVRQKMEKLFADGYAAVGMERREGRAEYLFVLKNEVEGLQLPETAELPAKRRRKSARQ